MTAVQLPFGHQTVSLKCPSALHTPEHLMGRFMPLPASPCTILSIPLSPAMPFLLFPPPFQREYRWVELLEPDIWAFVLASLLLSWMAFIISLNFLMLVVPSVK